MTTTPHETPALVADIGGTNARFAWLDHAAACPAHAATLPVAGHDTPLHAARAYLDAQRERLGAAWQAPRRAALAVATQVQGDRVVFTNSPWRFSRSEVQQALGLDELLLLNDFEALALALPHLGPTQWRAHHDPPRLDAPLAVLGPGTGLGVACCVPTAAGWVALPGEGGHATLAPADDYEAAVLSLARRRLPHVSAERLLSGLGLPLLHEVVSTLDGHPLQRLAAPEIVALAVDGDTVAGRTFEVFFAMLGGLAGNVALTVGARGGVFVGGGIVPRLGELFFASSFRERFEAKGRLQPWLAAIPTALITDTDAALTGAASALRRQPRTQST